jgi:hypothetical protein
MEKKYSAVEFDDDALPLLLDLFDKEVDDENRIVDKNVKEVEVDPYSGEELTTETFGGVLVGSKVLVSRNDASFAEHISIFCKNE